MNYAVVSKAEGEGADKDNVAECLTDHGKWPCLSRMHVEYAADRGIPSNKRS